MEIWCDVGRKSAGAPATRSTASAGCCAAPPTAPGRGCWPGSTPTTDDEQLARTWIAAQELRLIYHSPERGRAEQALYRWLTYCADADIPELTRLARTIDSWRAELLAYFDTAKVSNDPTED